MASTLRDLLIQRAARLQDRPALTTPDWGTLSYAQLRNRVEGVALGLLAIESRPVVFSATGTAWDWAAEVAAAASGLAWDPVGQVVPPEVLAGAWELQAEQGEEFVQYVLSSHPQCYRVRSEQQSRLYQSRDAEQLWINMSAATILGQSSAIKAAIVAPASASSVVKTAGGAVEDDAASVVSGVTTATSESERFYFKALNRDATAMLRAGSSSELTARFLAENSSVAGVKSGSNASAATTALEREIVEAELMVDVINKLTYCKVTTFQSDCITVSALLSSQVQATLAFHMHRSEVDGSASGDVLLTVRDTEVDLVVQPGGGNGGNNSNAFVSAFFASIMCSDEHGGGCLSSKSLLAVEEPYQIPDLLQRVSDYMGDVLHYCFYYCFHSFS